MKTSRPTSFRRMMESVVNCGNRPRPPRSPASTVAGKTGTAERGDGTNNAWFIAFAPADDPEIAIAVVVESTTGQGGQVAAPIAKQVMETLLG